MCLSPKGIFYLNSLKRPNVTIEALQKVTKKLVDVAVPSTTDEGGPQSQQTQNEATGSAPASKKRKKNKGKKAPGKKASEDDTVLEYARDIRTVLLLGVLYMEFTGAIRG